MNRTRVLTSVALWIVGACSSAPSLPCEARGTDWVVRAERAGDAERVGRLLDRLVPAVRAELGAQAALVTVLVAREGMPDRADGRTLRNGVILLDPAATDAEALLAHELAHRFLETSEAWDRLPPIVEEGLADVVAGEVVPGMAFSIELHHLGLLPERGSLDSGRRAIRTILLEDMYGEDDAHALRLRAIGFVLARRLGVGGLRALCEEARRREHEKVPADWLLEACGVGEREEVGVWARILGEANADGWSRFPIEPARGRGNSPTAAGPGAARPSR